MGGMIVAGPGADKTDIPPRPSTPWPAKGYGGKQGAAGATATAPQAPTLAITSAFRNRSTNSMNAIDGNNNTRAVIAAI